MTITYHCNWYTPLIKSPSSIVDTAGGFEEADVPDNIFDAFDMVDSQNAKSQFYMLSLNAWRSLYFFVIEMAP